MFGNVCNLTAKLLLNSPGFMKSCLLVEVSDLGQVVRFVLDVRRRSDFQILMTDHGLLLSRGRLRRKVQPDNGHFLQHVMTVYFSFFSGAKEQILFAACINVLLQSIILGQVEALSRHAFFPR